MRGPKIITRTIEAAQIPGKYGNTWQYHSRSDHHSKVSCVAIMFDLMESCTTLRRDAETERIYFGVNHEMSDFKTGRKKNLDLVISTRGTGPPDRNRTLAELVDQYQLVLESGDWKALENLPPLTEGPVGAVRLALEAKACMTAHRKALPRLYDELSSSHLTIHAATNVAIASGFAMVNAASEFVSTDMNKVDLSVYPERRNVHNQPADAEATIAKLRELPRRTQRGEQGFDAFGILVVDLANDGSPVRLVEEPPAVDPTDVYHYESMIHRTAQLYEDRYSAS